MKQVAWRAASLVLIVAVSGGCYAYAPVQTAQRGMDVRARLTTEAAVKRSQGLDEPVIIVDGTVIETTPTTVSVDVLVARTSSVFQDVVIRDTVRLETLEIQSLMARKFSPAKTALVTIGIGLAAYGAIKGIDQVVGGTDDPGGPGDPNIRASRRSWVGIPVLRFGTGR